MNGRIVNLGAGQQGRTFAISSSRAGQADGLRQPLAETEQPEKSKTDATSHQPDLLTRSFKALDRSLPLPDNGRSYTYFLLAILVVTAGMMVQLMLSASTLQSEVELYEKQNRHTGIERDNGEILWRIGRETNLRNVEARALQAGYKPIEEREYVDANGKVVDASSAPSSLRSMLQERASAEADSEAESNDGDAPTEPIGNEYETMKAETAANQSDSVPLLLATMFVEQLEEWAGSVGSEIDRATHIVTESVTQSANGSAELNELSRNASEWQSERLRKPIQGAVEWAADWFERTVGR